MKSLFLNPLARPGALIAFAVAALSGGAAHAAGTLSGTSISNLATLSYSVGGTAQTSIGSSAVGNTSGAGTVTSFVVDNKVNPGVVEGSFNGGSIFNAGAVTNVAPGAVAQVTSFVVINNGNTPQGYTLSAINFAGGTIASTADSIDVTINNVFVDANGNGTYEAGTDVATTIASLAPDASVTVFVLATIPAGATNGQQANITLTATTKTAGLSAAAAAAETYVATVGVDTTGVDIVFADGPITEANFVGTSSARDGQATARDAYRITSAVISVQKTAALLCDPFNGATNRKSIPGATVQYAITITNAASATASATLTQISDALEIANLTFDATLISGAGAGSNCVAGVASQSGTGFGAVRGTGTVITSYAAPGPGTVAQAVTAGATFVSPNVVINFTTLAGTAYGAADPVLPANSFITVYFNTFVK